MNALLDTCTFLWLALEPGRISAAAREILDDPGTVRRLSQASVLEIVLKHRAGKSGFLHAGIFSNWRTFLWTRP
jgi:PIN domain nuclease of toxin-antitoxin system